MIDCQKNFLSNNQTIHSFDQEKKWLGNRIIQVTLFVMNLAKRPGRFHGLYLYMYA